MLLALLATVPTVAPTATLVPTATPVPTPISTIPPVNINITNGNEWEIISIAVALLGVLATICLGRAALNTSRAANEASKTAIKASETANDIAKQQLKREEEMRKQEAKIATFENAFEVYRFFAFDLSRYLFENNYEFPTEREQHVFNEKKLEIRYCSEMIFEDNVHKQIVKLLELASFCYAPKLIGNEDVLLHLAKKYDFEDKLNGLSFETDSERTSILTGIISDRIHEIFDKYRLKL